VVNPAVTTQVLLDFPANGKLSLAWTVYGSAPATGCPIGATVSAVSTRQLGISPVSVGPVSCTTSTLKILLPDYGVYLFDVTLSSGGNSTTVSGLAVTSTPGSSTFFNFDFVLPLLAAPTFPHAQPLDGSIRLDWSAVTGAWSYNIYRATTPGVTPATGTKINVSSSPYINAPLNPALTYYYVITAVDAGGVEGPPSTEVSAKPNGIPLPV